MNFSLSAEMRHCLFISGLMATGTACLVWAYLLLPRHREKEKYRSRQALPTSGTGWVIKHIIWATFLLFAGICLLAYMGHSELTSHKDILSSLFSSGNNGDFSLVLAGLAVVMTLVTAGVITISRHALDDIRREKQGLQDSYEEVTKLELWHRVTTLRLELLYVNQQELDSYSLSGDDLAEEEETRKLFRESLQPHYAKRKNISEYINDLQARYSPDTHGKLLPLEIDYLREIQKYYQEFPDQQPENQDIPAQVDDILKR